MTSTKHKGIALPINFTLTPEQRELQLSARRFARAILTEVGPATRSLHAPLERFVATQPMYEALVKAGFMRRITPTRPGEALARAPASTASTGHRRQQAVDLKRHRLGRAKPRPAVRRLPHRP